jgi:hypothetical protein
VTIALIAAAAGAEEPVVIDPTRGNVDGKRGVAIWPGDPHQRGPADPTGYKVHLIPAVDLDAELIFPCGEWFAPDPGRYRYWIEGRGKMTPHSFALSYSGSPFRGRGMAAVVHALVPAGTVRLGSAIPLTGLTLRLLHANSHNRGEFPQRELTRRATGNSARHGVAMPEGPVIAALYDHTAKEYRAISRPVVVRAGETVEVAPAPPEGESDLLVVLERAAVANDFENYDVEPRLLEVVNGPRAADLVIRTATRLYALWYGVSDRRARLEIESPSVFLEPQDLVLRPGKVEYRVAELQPLPDLEVRLDLPQELRGSGLSVEVSDGSSRKSIRRRELEPQATVEQFQRLPAVELQVTVEAPPWRFHQRVDLSEGSSRAVSFAPEPILVHGSIYRGDEGVSAVVDFVTELADQSRKVAVRTDTEGRYETVLWRPGSYLTRLYPAAGGATPYLEMTEVADRPTVAIDFHLPAARYLVRVVDRQTGKGVPGAEVIADNPARSGPTTSQRVLADDAGLAELQPLRPGEVTLRAEAEGYLPSPRRTEPVVDEEGAHELLVQLEPVGSVHDLELRLPEGRPAGGAEVRAQATLGDGGVLWRGQATADGKVTVPERFDGAFLLVRHPDAASVVRRWRVPVDGDDAELLWTLPPSAGPLTIRTLDGWGEPAPWARLVLWIDGVQVTGSTLAWLTFGRVGAADGEGFWQGSHLPPAPLQALAWRPGRGPEQAAGYLDPLAVTISHPWSGVRELRAIE